jgi:hypothetical protein
MRTSREAQAAADGSSVHHNGRQIRVRGEKTLANPGLPSARKLNDVPAVQGAKSTCLYLTQAECRCR